MALTTKSSACPTARPLHLRADMKSVTSTIVLSAVPLCICLAGCEPEMRCPYGEEPIRVAIGTRNERWACAARSTYPESKPPTTSAAPDAGTATVTASSDREKDAGAAPAPPAAPPGSCGVVDSASDTVRVIEKREAAPTFDQAAPKPVDGHYELVQASFFRREAGPIGVARLQAGIDVTGTSISIGAQNISQTTEASESMTFLLAEGGLTKVCETRHGSVAQWIFPIATGATGTARLEYDALASTLRLVVARPEGETELIFSR